MSFNGTHLKAAHDVANAPDGVAPCQLEDDGPWPMYAWRLPSHHIRLDSLCLGSAEPFLLPP